MLANVSDLQCIECVQAVPVLHLDELDIGDHVVFDRGHYAHHGIIVSNIKDGKFKIVEATAKPGVASATSSSKSFGRKADIECSWQELNLQEQRILVVVYKNGRYSGMDTALRAQRYYADVKFRGYKYNLLTNNCEHFATYCATGHQFSLQVKKVDLVTQLFLTGRIGNEKQRNESLFRNKIICEPCYIMNLNLLDVTHVAITNDEDIKIGDIIQYSYWRLLHNAVVLKKIRTNTMESVCSIAHYAYCGPFHDKTIKEETLGIRFDGGYFKLDYALPRYDVYAPEVVVKRAKSRIGEQLFKNFINDSSHFARWCKLKLWTSQHNLERMT